MNPDEFMEKVCVYREAFPRWRFGQTLFNVAFLYIPDFANSVRGTNADPFHCTDDTDPRVELFLSRLAEYLQEKDAE